MSPKGTAKKKALIINGARDETLSGEIRETLGPEFTLEDVTAADAEKPLKNRKDWALVISLGYPGSNPKLAPVADDVEFLSNLFNKTPCKSKPDERKGNLCGTQECCKRCLRSVPILRAVDSLLHYSIFHKEGHKRGVTVVPFLSTSAATVRYLRFLSRAFGDVRSQFAQVARADAEFRAKPFHYEEHMVTHIVDMKDYSKIESNLKTLLKDSVGVNNADVPSTARALFFEIVRLYVAVASRIGLAAGSLPARVTGDELAFFHPLNESKGSKYEPAAAAMCAALDINRETVELTEVLQKMYEPDTRKSPEDPPEGVVHQGISHATAGFYVVPGGVQADHVGTGTVTARRLCTEDKECRVLVDAETWDFLAKKFKGLSWPAHVSPAKRKKFPCYDLTAMYPGWKPGGYDNCVERLTTQPGSV